MSEVLKGSSQGSEFDFGSSLRANQERATNKGFDNVSQVWYDKTISFEQGLEQLSNQVAEREDIEENLTDAVIGVEPSGGIGVGIDGRTFMPTLHALLQLSTWLDVPHTMVKWYLSPKVGQNGKVKFTRDTVDTELVVRALRNGMRHVKSDKSMLFRTYQDGTLRAVLSDRYAIIDNRWYLETLQDLLPEGRLSHWSGDADTLYGNVLIPDTMRQETDSGYGGMLSVGNCEIGIRLLEQYPSIFRHICMNGCIWDRSKGNILTQVHRGNVNLDDLRIEICNNVHKQIPLMQSAVDRFLSMRDRKVTGKLSKLFACIAKENGFTNEQANATIQEWLQNEKSDRNAFGVINAITRTGQKFDNVTWLDFDILAGKIMNLSNDGWLALNTRADNLDDKVVEKVFATAV